MDEKHTIDGTGPRSADVLVCGFSEPPGSEFQLPRSGVSGERRQLKLVESNGREQKSTEANEANEGKSLLSDLRYLRYLLFKNSCQFVKFVSHLCAPTLPPSAGKTKFNT